MTTLTDLQNQLKRQLASQALRWARPEGIHLTLKFLGDTSTGSTYPLHIQRVPIPKVDVAEFFDE